jgi:hypothetical protein
MVSVSVLVDFSLSGRTLLKIDRSLSFRAGGIEAMVSSGQLCLISDNKAHKGKKALLMARRHKTSRLFFAWKRETEMAAAKQRLTRQRELPSRAPQAPVVPPLVERIVRGAAAAVRRLWRSLKEPDHTALFLLPPLPFFHTPRSCFSCCTTQFEVVISEEAGDWGRCGVFWRGE